jgi:hypothetical protein
MRAHFYPIVDFEFKYIWIFFERYQRVSRMETRISVSGKISEILAEKKKTL